MAAVIVFAGGCGGGGGSKTTTTTAGPPASTTVPPPGQAQLGMIVVQPSDLPTGWAAQAPSVPYNRVGVPMAFSQCVGTTVTAPHVAGTAYSHTFVMGTDVITSNAVSFTTLNDVPADTQALASPKASGCLQQVEKNLFTALLPAGSTVRTYQVKVTPGNNGVAANVVAVADSTITYSVTGHSLTLTIEVVYFAAPRIEAQVSFSSAGTAIPVATKAAVLNKVSARVQFGS